MGTEPFGLQAGLRPYLCKRRISPAKAPYFNDSGISVVSSTLSIFLLRLCEKPSRAKVALDSRNDDQSPVDKLVTGR